MLGPSAGALRCFRCGKDRLESTDLVFIMVSEDLNAAEDRWSGMCGGILPRDVNATSRTGDPSPAK